MYGRVMRCGTVTFYLFEVGEAPKIFFLCNCPCCKTVQGYVRQSSMVVGMLPNVHLRLCLCVCLCIEYVSTYLFVLVGLRVWETDYALSSVNYADQDEGAGRGRSGCYTAFELEESKHPTENTTTWNKMVCRGWKRSGCIGREAGESETGSETEGRMREGLRKWIALRPLKRERTQGVRENETHGVLKVMFSGIMRNRVQKGNQKRRREQHKQD